ncbi:hypothetical protein BJV78DRAFT_1152110 [Lactifluus subvellereus]|nr:hypothetical protein BJV78DRAFT_1152110 [Lactifluus subvellereus]
MTPIWYFQQLLDESDRLVMGNQDEFHVAQYPGIRLAAHQQFRTKHCTKGTHHPRYAVPSAGYIGTRRDLFGLDWMKVAACAVCRNGNGYAAGSSVFSHKNFPAAQVIGQLSRVNKYPKRSKCEHTAMIRQPSPVATWLRIYYGAVIVPCDVKRNNLDSGRTG